MNIRVMDVSIIPLHIVAHVQGEIWSYYLLLDFMHFFSCMIIATAYAIGELGRYSESIFLYCEVLQTGWLMIWTISKVLISLKTGLIFELNLESDWQLGTDFLSAFDTNRTYFFSDLLCWLL
jgi:hypothetical protein